MKGWPWKRPAPEPDDQLEKVVNALADLRRVSLELRNTNVALAARVQREKRT